MRISSNGAFQRGLGLMQQLQTALDHTQQQIATGRRILNPSDDPVASSRAIELQESLSRLDQFDRNSAIARNRLGYEETALASVNDVLQRVRELALQANNATQSNESRRQIAVEMREHVDQLVQLANQQDGNGRYLFSGNRDDTAPVSRSGKTFSYNGDRGQRFIQIAESRQIAAGDSGADVFFRISNGNGVFAVEAAVANAGDGVLGPGSVVDQAQYDGDQYTIRFVDPLNYEVLDGAAATIATGAFQSGDSIEFRGIAVSLEGGPAAGDEFVVSASSFTDVFSTVEQLATAVELSVDSGTVRAELNNGINSGIQGIDQAIGNVLDIRTQVGSRLAAADNQEDSNAGFALTLSQTLAEIRDLDYAEAISRLSLQASTLEAAQQSFIRTRSLSLFNFL